MAQHDAVLSTVPQIYPITIKTNHNSYIVTAGCISLSFHNAGTMLSALEDYLNGPGEFVELYGLTGLTPNPLQENTAFRHVFDAGIDGPALKDGP